MGYPIKQIREYLQECYKGAQEQCDLSSMFRIGLAIKVLSTDLDDIYKEEIRKNTSDNIEFLNIKSSPLHNTKSSSKNISPKNTSFDNTSSDNTIKSNNKYTNQSSSILDIINKGFEEITNIESVDDEEEPDITEEDIELLINPYAFTEEICFILDIDIPDISFDTSFFESETMLAQYRPSNNTLFIKDVDAFNLDSLFAISHELRHAWQIEYHKDMLADYKTLDELSFNEYNLQIAELDANAFGAAVLYHVFKAKPLFNNFPDYIKKKIYELADEIILYKD